MGGTLNGTAGGISFSFRSADAKLPYHGLGSSHIRKSALWLRAALLLIAVLWSAQVLGAAKHRFPEDETPEERYWKKVRAEEQQRQAAEQRWHERYRDRIKSVAADIVKAGEAIQPELIVAEDGPPPPPVAPSLFKRYPDETRLAGVAALVLAL